MLVFDRLQAPDVRPGIAKELRQYQALLEAEIAELTVLASRNDQS